MHLRPARLLILLRNQNLFIPLFQVTHNVWLGEQVKGEEPAHRLLIQVRLLTSFNHIGWMPTFDGRFLTNASINVIFVLRFPPIDCLMQLNLLESETRCSKNFFSPPLPLCNFQAPLLVSVIGGSAPVFLSLEEVNLPPYHRHI